MVLEYFLKKSINDNIKLDSARELRPYLLKLINHLDEFEDITFKSCLIGGAFFEIKSKNKSKHFIKICTADKNDIIVQRIGFLYYGSVRREPVDRRSIGHIPGSRVEVAVRCTLAHRYSDQVDRAVRIVVLGDDFMDHGPGAVRFDDCARSS